MPATENINEMTPDQLLENYLIGKSIKTEKRMTTITLDIETLPTDDPELIRFIKDNLSAPGNYKDPVKIEKWIEENTQPAIEKTSLNGLFGRVYCVGIAVDDDDPIIMKHLNPEVGFNHEYVVLQMFSNYLSDFKPGTYVIAGHNINKFDLKFLSQRMVIHGLKPILDPYGSPYKRNVDDTMEMLAFGDRRDFISLNDACRAFGIESPKSEEFDGSKIYERYLEGRHDEVYEYCKKDVIATRELYKRITGKKQLSTPSTIKTNVGESLESVL